MLKGLMKTRVPKLGQWRNPRACNLLRIRRHIETRSIESFRFSLSLYTRINRETNCNLSCYYIRTSTKRNKNNSVHTLGFTRTVYKPKVCKNIVRESIEEELDSFCKNLQTITEIFQFVLTHIYDQSTMCYVLSDFDDF